MMNLQSKDGTPHGRSFEFVQCLGRGGFGEVYLARMCTPGLGVPAKVAIKMLHDNVVPGSDAAARLVDEARVTVLLGHPGILHVLDLVELGGRLALITEYVDGQDLGECLQSGMPRRAMMQAMARVVDALGAAHAAGVVHRDVKPANIRIGRHGQSKLLDFGIAHASSLNREAKTASGLIVGSQGYMSPERLRGIVHGGADIFAVGCVLYEGLTDSALFDDVGPGHLVGICFDEEVYHDFISQRLALVNAPRSVSNLLQRCLAHDPAERIDGPDLAHELERLAPRLRGLGLVQWCRERDWPGATPVNGSLTGTTLVEWTLPHPKPAPPRELVTAQLPAPQPPPQAATTHLPARPASKRRWPALLLLGLGAMLTMAAAATVSVGVWSSGMLTNNAITVVQPREAKQDLEVTLKDESLPSPPETPPAGPGIAQVAPQHVPKSAPPERTIVTPTVAEAPVSVEAVDRTDAPPRIVADVEATEPHTEAVAEPQPAEIAQPQPRTVQPARRTPVVTPSAKGTVVVSGGVQVRLIGSHGEQLSPGPVPIGTYAVQALFREQWKATGSIHVASNTTTTLFCSDRMRRCAER